MEAAHRFQINIDEEIKRSYLDYAMSVIIGRALPDARDGFKPVHRRVLWAMHELSNTYNKPYKKSARVVGDAIGKFHPHGESAVYETIVRLVQTFSIRYPLIDGQGNFGCFTGDTKIKLLDGTEKSFAELAELGPGERFYVYSVDDTGRIVVGEGRNARITRHKARLIELTLDSGETIRCTLDHRFMLRDGTYKAAVELTPDDALMAGYFDTAPVKEGLNEYLRVLQPVTGKYEFVHYLADGFNVEQGRAREMKGPFVRHHKNFNRWDNRPPNIERMRFLEHLEVHASQMRALWLDQTFRATQRVGVKRYYEEHPEVVEERRHRFVAQNQDESFRRENGKRVSAALKHRYREDFEARAEFSRRMKRRWQDPVSRAEMMAALSNVKKRQLTEDEKARVAQIISQKSRAMWADEVKRPEIIEAITRALAPKEVRAKMSMTAKSCWRNPEYRAKYPEDHFSQMARKLWSDPHTRELHRVKAAQQWQDPEFREVQRKRVQQCNAKRMRDNPHVMSDLAARAATVLVEKWTDPAYRRQVMRQKIARYVNRLLVSMAGQKITPAVYEARRDANWIPRLETALKYFKDFDELVQAGQRYNHRVVSKRWLNECADVYDLTVEKHHNFLLASGVFVHNSVDGDEAAAMRYTEVRLARIADEVLADIEKNTVDYQPNYDESLEEPTVLPVRFPNLLVNGGSGIAVGMATNIPPHNLTEIIEATVHLVQNPDAAVTDLMKFVPGPDFPTGGFIYGREGIKQAYLTGRGSIIMRARAAIDRIGRGTSQKDAIVITEIPYQVNKAKLIEKIAELVNERRLDGISDLRDESDRQGMRIVIELKREAVPQVILNKLYKLTQMQESFGVINLAIVNGQPKVLKLVETLQEFVNFRREVVRRRTEFELQKAEARAHILEGLKRALDLIDAIIALIRKAKSGKDAREGLIARFKFTEIQAQAILDMKLERLTGLERQKLIDEYEEIIKKIAELREILGSERVLRTVIVRELRAVQKDFGDDRRTQIVDAEAEFTLEDLIPNEEVVITTTHSAFIKRTPLLTFRQQGRGTRGRFGMTLRGEDFVTKVFVASTHSYIMVFTDQGKVYNLKVHEIPEAQAASRGKAITNLANVSSNEKVAGVISVREFRTDRYVVMVTRKGVIKKTDLSEFDNMRASGLIAMGVDEGDELISVELTDGQMKIFIATHDGMAICFDEDDVRSMGRQARGVRGVDLRDGDFVVSVSAVKGDEQMLSVTENGYGKQTRLSEYRVQSRGGVGVINVKTTEKNGKVVAVMPVTEDDEVMIITGQGKLLRTDASAIRETGRSAQGVRLIKMTEDDSVAAASLVARADNEVSESNGPEK